MPRTVASMPRNATKKVETPQIPTASDKATPLNMLHAATPTNSTKSSHAGLRLVPLKAKCEYLLHLGIRLSIINNLTHFCAKLHKKSCVYI